MDMRFVDASVRDLLKLLSGFHWIQGCKMSVECTTNTAHFITTTAKYSRKRVKSKFVQVRHPGGVPFAVLMGCLIAAMLGVYITQQSPSSKGRAKKGRSTDRVD